MAHPIHVHGVQFRVIERDRAAAPAGLRVRLQVAPTVSGLFVYHCHNLEHEDGGMMRNCLFSERRASKRAG